MGNTFSDLFKNYDSQNKVPKPSLFLPEMLRIPEWCVFSSCSASLNILKQYINPLFFVKKP